MPKRVTAARPAAFQISQAGDENRDVRPGQNPGEDREAPRLDASNDRLADDRARASRDRARGRSELQGAFQSHVSRKVPTTFPSSVPSGLAMVQSISSLSGNSYRCPFA